MLPATAPAGPAPAVVVAPEVAAAVAAPLADLEIVAADAIVSRTGTEQVKTKSLAGLHASASPSQPVEHCTALILKLRRQIL